MGGSSSCFSLTMNTSMQHRAWGSAAFDADCTFSKGFKTEETSLISTTMSMAETRPSKRQKNLKEEVDDEVEEGSDQQSDDSLGNQASKTASSALRNDQGELYFDLGGGLRRVTARKFKGAVLVDIREVSHC